MERNGFSWHDEKSDECLEGRGFDFEFARQVFSSFSLDRLDYRHPYGEPRFQTAGRIGGLLFVVVWTPRGTLRHIISARRAREGELSKWL